MLIVYQIKNTSALSWVLVCRVNYILISRYSQVLAAIRVRFRLEIMKLFQVIKLAGSISEVSWEVIFVFSIGHLAFFYFLVIQL